jgi:hypothetical protein
MALVALGVNIFNGRVTYALCNRISLLSRESPLAASFPSTPHAIAIRSGDQDVSGAWHVH